MKNRTWSLFFTCLIIAPLFFSLPEVVVHAREKESIIQSKHRGPLNISNTFPAAVFFLNYRPLRAGNLRKGEFQVLFDVDEANTIVVERTFDGTSEVILDSGLTQFRIDLSVGLTRKIELGISTAVLSYHGGFMDGFIEAVEGAAGQSSGTRKGRKKNDFRIFLVRDNDVLLDLDDNTTGWGDSTVRLKYALLEERGPYAIDISTRFEVKIPTGEEYKGMGSDSVDLGASLLMHKSFGKAHFQVDLAYQILGDLKLGKKFNPENVFTTVFATEYSWDRISAILQFTTTQSALRKIGISRLEEGGQAVVLGMKYDILKNLMLQLSMTENTSDVTFSDFSINAGMEYRFGKEAPSKKLSKKQSEKRSKKRVKKQSKKQPKKRVKKRPGKRTK